MVTANNWRKEIADQINKSGGELEREKLIFEVGKKVKPGTAYRKAEYQRRWQRQRHRKLGKPSIYEDDRRRPTKVERDEIIRAGRRTIVTTAINHMLRDKKLAKVVRAGKTYYTLSGYTGRLKSTGIRAAIRQSIISHGGEAHRKTIYEDAASAVDPDMAIRRAEHQRLTTQKRALRLGKSRNQTLERKHNKSREHILAVGQRDIMADSLVDMVLSGILIKTKKEDGDYFSLNPDAKTYVSNNGRVGKKTK